MPTVQEILKRTRPALFEDRGQNPEIIQWRDDPRWNDPIFRKMQVLKMMGRKIPMAGPEKYYTLVYCEKEGRPFVRAFDRWVDDQIRDVPRPLWVRWHETCLKIERLMNKLEASPKNFLKAFFISLGTSTLCACFVSPIFLIATGFSGLSYWCVNKAIKDE
jgi:hypothetical protein